MWSDRPKRRKVDEPLERGGTAPSDRLCGVLRSILPLGMVWAIAVTGLSGCKHRDLVEAELRYQNRQVRELKRKLCQRESEVHTLNAILENNVDGSCATTEPRETPETIYRKEAMSKVSLGMSTGPRDIDRDGCAEAVQFTIVCHDYDGDIFKCPGSAKLELASFQESGVIVPVSSWDIDSEKLKGTWKTSALSSGYQVIVTAPVLEQAKKWRAIVQFQTLDGRVFRDERDFTYNGKEQAPISLPIPEVPPVLRDEPEAEVPVEQDLPALPSADNFNSEQPSSISLTGLEEKELPPITLNPPPGFDSTK